MTNLNFPNKPERRLTNLTVNFVSLVPQGANPGAEIVITKEKDSMDVQLNLDQQVLGDLIAKALGGVNECGDPAPMNEENLKKAFESIRGDLSGLINETITKALSDTEKVCADRKKEEPEVKEEATQKSLDETLTIGEQIIQKSVVGESAFAAFKTMQVELAKQRHEAELSQLTVQVEKEYPNIPGEPRTKALLLKSILAMPKEVQDMAKSLLAQAESNLSAKMNKEAGTATVPAETSIGKEAEDKLDNLAKEYAQKNNVSYFKAYQAVLESDTGSALYEQARS